MKKFLAVLLCLCMLSAPAHAASLQFTIGETEAKTLTTQEGITEKTLEIAPFTVDGRTMVPIRVIAENFGATVDWDDATQTAYVHTEAVTIALPVGVNSAVVNGETVALDVATMEQNGRTLVPLRFVSEVLGYNVKYVPSTEQIYITDSPIVFKSPYSFITLEDLWIGYLEFEALNIPQPETEAEVESIKGMHTEVLSYLFDVYSVRTGIYDHMYYKAADAEFTGVVKEAIVEPEYQESLMVFAEGIGMLDAAVNAYMELGISEIYYPEICYSRLPMAELEERYNQDFICAKHILIPTVNLQNGAALSAEEVAAAEALANDLSAQIAEGADFDALMQTYSKDTGLVANPEGYVFTEGEMVEEFYNGANALEIGEVSTPVLSPFGYHIIKREPLPAMTEEQAQTYAEEVLYNEVIEILSAHDFELAMDLDTLLDMLVGR